MGKKEDFKVFVKNNPQLLEYVKNGESSWQKFYEIYDLYGDSTEAWSKYTKTAEKVAVATNFTDILSWVKNINLDSVQSSVNNLQKMLGVVQGLSSKDETTKEPEYKSRPLYKHFDD